MLSGISITCFASSYAVALCLESTRLAFRSGIRGAIMLGFAGAGLFAHSVFLYHRATTISGPPLSSERDWYLLAAWGLAALYLYLTYYHRNAPFGLFVLPLVLTLLGLAAFVANPQPFTRAPASRIWGLIHGVSILLATLAVLFGFATGLMYLYQAYCLKRKAPPRDGLQLPNLEWLERANSRAIVISLGMLTVGVLSGIILNLIRDAGQVPWYDPVVLSTAIMSAWLVATAGCGLCYQPARRGRKVASLTVVSFLFLTLVLGAELFLTTQHGGLRPPRPSDGTSGLSTSAPGDLT
jgi:ABC-type uncharacterized transport system permease subunit